MLHPDWVEKLDAENNLPYYVNKKTKKSQWEKPTIDSSDCVKPLTLPPTPPSPSSSSSPVPPSSSSSLFSSSHSPSFSSPHSPSSSSSSLSSFSSLSTSSSLSESAFFPKSKELKSQDLDDDQLDIAFEKLLTDQLITPEKRKQMIATISNENKRKMLGGQHKKIVEASNIQVRELRSRKDKNSIQSIRVSLTGANEKYLREFFACDGLHAILEAIFEKINKPRKVLDDMDMLFECALCVKKIMNNPVGFDLSWKFPGVFRDLVLVLNPPTEGELLFVYYKVATEIISILSPLCLMGRRKGKEQGSTNNNNNNSSSSSNQGDEQKKQEEEQELSSGNSGNPTSFTAVGAGAAEGQKIVLSAFDYFQFKCSEKHRFQTLVELFVNKDVPAEYKAEILKLFNSLLVKFEFLHQRVRMREELNAHRSFSRAVDTYLSEENSQNISKYFRTQLKTYHDECEEDAKEYKMLKNDVSVGCDVTVTFDALLNLLTGTDTCNILNNILLSISLFDRSSAQLWMFAGRMIDILVKEGASNYAHGTQSILAALTKDNKSRMIHISELQQAEINLRAQAMGARGLLAEFDEIMALPPGSQIGEEVQALVDEKNRMLKAAEDREIFIELDMAEDRLREALQRAQKQRMKQSAMFATTGGHLNSDPDSDMDVEDIRKRLETYTNEFNNLNDELEYLKKHPPVLSPPSSPSSSSSSSFSSVPISPKGGGGGDSSSSSEDKEKGGEVENESVVPPAPPPPLPGGIPPPPSIFSGPPKKPSHKPAKPMKVFHWARIADNQIEKSFWKIHKLSDEHIKLDIAELEELFEKKDKDKDKGKTLTASGSTSSLPFFGSSSSSTILEPHRINNIAVVLSQFGSQMGPNEVADAIDRCDMKVLLPQRIRTLCGCLPTEEELTSLHEYDGDPSRLTKSERFFLRLGQVACLEMRLRSLLFRVRCEELLDYLSPSLDTLLSACSELLPTRSPALAHTLQFLLAVGNYLNGGSPNEGGAYGYKLDTLAKTADFKSNIVVDIKQQQQQQQQRQQQGTGTGVQTLLQYMVKKMRDGSSSSGIGSYNKLMKELAHVVPASRLSVEGIGVDLKELTTGVTNLAHDISVLKNATNDKKGKVAIPAGEGDVVVLTTAQKVGVRSFLDIVVPFHQSILAEHKKLLEKKSTLDRQLLELIEGYGENPSQMSSQEFFDVFASFLNRIERTVKMQDEKEERDRKATQRTKEEEKERNRGGIVFMKPDKAAKIAQKELIDSVNEALNAGILLRRNRGTND